MADVSSVIKNITIQQHINSLLKKACGEKLKIYNDYHTDITHCLITEEIYIFLRARKEHGNSKPLEINKNATEQVKRTPKNIKILHH